jgi:hypothetical protein
LIERDLLLLRVEVGCRREENDDGQQADEAGKTGHGKAERANRDGETESAGGERLKPMCFLKKAATTFHSKGR